MDINQILNDLLLHSENEVVEFKEAKSSFDIDKLGEYFSALSNEANLKGKECAWLVFGVNDKRQIVGTAFRTDANKLHHLKEEIGNHTPNRSSFQEIYEVKRPEGRVILFQISPAPKGMPVARKGHYYWRDYESLQALSLEKLERIRIQAGENDWSKKIVYEATLSDLDTLAIKKAREDYLKTNPNKQEDVDSWDDSTFLNKIGITYHWQITNTALLLLGNEDAQYLLLPSAPKITRILKDSKGVERDYHHYQIPFLLAREEIINKIRNTKYRYMTGSSTIPTEVDTYDPYIIREALNNCIAHQDYRLGRRIIVVENENFLVFSNAGSFIPETIENVLQENSPSDEYRNEFLATAMVKLGLIDTMGSGIRKMFLTQQKRLFPLPDYKISKDRVIVVLTGEILDMNYARKLEQHPNLSLSEVILLDKLQKKHKLTGEELEILKNKKLIDENTSDITFPDTTSQKQKLGYIEPQKSKDERYKQIILEYIDKFGSISKEDINKLLMDELPVTLSERQKQSKINNIIYSMSRKDKSITNYGTIRYPRWEKN